MKTKKIVGERIKRQRENYLSVGRQEFCDLLGESKMRPNNDSILPVDNLKQWELGNNAVNIEWIPAICDVLECSADYLFGIIDEPRQGMEELHNYIGLSERSIRKLLHWKKCRDLNDNVYNVNRANALGNQYLEMVSEFICNNSILTATNNVGLAMMIQESGFDSEYKFPCEEIFEDEEEAIRYYTFQAMSDLQYFIEKFMKSH